ncbi:MAG: peroxidase-related enzyme [Chloroflexi bacterium]|nr:peroxidase-related enzyme [Chloroflexota bacterium]
MWIATQGPEDDPIIKDMYDHMQGRVVPMMSVFTLRPQLTKAVAAITRNVAFGGTSIGRYLEELIASRVCHLQRCRLCTTSHTAQLRRVSGKDPDWIKQVINDPENAGLEPRDLAILRFVSKATTAAATMSRQDVETLRAVGLSDENILDVSSCCAFYNFVPRIINSLGLEISERQVEWARFLGYEAEEPVRDVGVEMPAGVDFVDLQRTLWADS